jgi:hypothetical protein
MTTPYRSPSGPPDDPPPPPGEIETRTVCAECARPVFPHAAVCVHCGHRRHPGERGAAAASPKQKTMPATTARPAVAPPMERAALPGVDDGHGRWKRNAIVVGGALLIFVHGVRRFFELAELERGERAGIWINAFDSTLYDVAGKWGVLALSTIPLLLVITVYARARLVRDR